MSALDVEALSAAWPALVWVPYDGRAADRASTVTGTSKGGAIVVGRDFVEVYVQGIPGPAKSHDGTIAGVQRAVRASLGEVDAVIALLDPARAADHEALRKSRHDLANEVQALRSLVDEAFDLVDMSDWTASAEWFDAARKARRDRT